MIFDEQRTLRIIKDAPNAHIVKIFLWLAFNQPKDGIFGYKIPKSQIAGDLNLGRTVLFESLHWLKDNLAIQELKFVEYSDFMVNPYIVMNNSDKNERIKEWARRLKLEDEKNKKNRELKRRRELKKQSQQ